MEKPALSGSPLARGVRFAPSPTGRFHLGNLRTAWISHQWALALSEPWVLRFEDIDGPRVVPGARELQLEDMRLLGLAPDQVLIQSGFHSRHWDVFKHAVEQRVVYPCFCTRRDVRDALDASQSAPHLPPHLPPHEAPATYSGRCRDIAGRARAETHEFPTIAWRFAVPSDFSGHHDFIVARSAPMLDPKGLPESSSFVPAYHWACAIDDEDGNYALLVRAHDLSEVASQHRAISSWLAESEGHAPRWPAIFHTSLVVQSAPPLQGHRLEKRTQGVTLPELLAQGWTPARIQERFAAGFELNLADYSPHKILGELRSTITLHDLGFPG